MENFVLYEQLAQSDHCLIYKGRRKNTINFLAVNCADKCKRSEITNMVRLVHEIKHDNIVKFYEWYETSNHLWLILELCTGGSLQKLIKEDDHLPESCILQFGIDLVRGLHHLHSVGIIFSDIKPSKILVSGTGSLKYADFGLSRIDGEDLDEIFESYSDPGEGFHPSDQQLDSARTDRSDVPARLKTAGTPRYMAPEILDGAEHSTASDLWSLGCLFYEMFTGHPPFLGDNFKQLKDKIMNKELSVPRVKGSRVTTKPSAEFQNLLDCLLEKDPQKRMDWSELVVHPFWQGALQHLEKDLEAPVDIKQSIRESIANFQSLHITGDPDVLDGNNKNPDVSTSSVRLPTADNTEHQVQFTLSSRPHTAAAADDTAVDEHLSLASQQRLMQQVTARLRPGEGEDRTDISSLIYHASDFVITPIMDVVKQSQKTASFKYDPKALSVPPFSVDKLVAMSSKDQEKHLSAVIEGVSQMEKGPPSQKQIQLLNYIATIGGSNGNIANIMMRLGLFNRLAKQVKDCQQVELKCKLCQTISAVGSSVTEFDPSTNVAEVVSFLTEAAKDGFRVVKLKTALLPAIGEILFLIASQEDLKGSSVPCWAVPPATYSCVIKCLADGEETVVNHFAAKIVDNIATKSGQHSMKFVTGEVGQLLWGMYSRSTIDPLRVTALSAFARLARFSDGTFLNILQGVGLSKVLTILAVPTTKIQQAVVTVLLLLVTSQNRPHGLHLDKEFLVHIMRLLESPSTVIRAKAFLTVIEIIKHSNDQLLVACQNRLVMYIERDSRRQVAGKMENVGQNEYLNTCLELLLGTLVELSNHVSKEILTALDAVTGRKRPTAIQMNDLKSVLPWMAIIQNFVNSSVIRPKIISSSFMKNLSTFLNHLLSIDSGSTQIRSAIGSSGTEEFANAVFGSSEFLVQHPAMVVEHLGVVSSEILPSLAALISKSSGNTRGQSLRLFSELASIILSQEMCNSNKYESQTKQFNRLVVELLLPQYEQILLEQDPLPSYGLRLLCAWLEQYPVYIRDVEKLNLVSVIFQVLVDHQNNPFSCTMQQIAALLNCLVMHKETNMKELYEQGIVDHFNFLFVEVSTVCLNSEENVDKSVLTMFLLLLDTLHGMLKYVSDIVRRALESKKVGAGDQISTDAEQAETLLLLNKPFTEFVSPLTQLLVHEDADVADTSLKCLALLVQFFGGDHANSMSPANMESYSEALKKSDVKKQKIILRLIKRLIVTERSHAESMKQHGAKLAETVKTVAATASTNAEVALSTVAFEILKATGYMN